MKKLLSLILAMAMILTLAPFAFAEGEAETTTQNFTIRYDLSGDMFKQGMVYINQTVPFSTINYTATDGFYEIKSVDGKTVPDNNYVQYGGLTDFSGNCNIIMKANRAAVFEIYIPVAGTYKINVDHGYDTAGKVMRVLGKQGEYTQFGDLAYVGGYTCEGDGKGFSLIKNSEVVKSEDQLTLTEEPATITVTEPGKYAIAFQTYYSASSTGGKGSVGSFELVSGDGNGIAIMNGSLAVEDSELSVGEETSITAVAGLSSVTRESLTGFTYDSSDDDVATVDTNGKITAVGAGTATISATVAGAVNPITTTVTVTDPNAVTIKYNLGEILYNDETARMNNSNSRGFKDVFNYKTSNGFFNYVKASTETGRFSTSPVQYPSESTTNELVERALVFRKISDTQDGGYIAFEVNVPVSGTYTMKAIARYHTPRIVHVYHVTEDTTDYTNSKYEIGTYNNKEHYKEIVNTLCDVLDSNNSAVKISLTKGKHIFAFKGDYSEIYGDSYYASLGDFYLISGDGNGAALMPYFNGEATLEVGETATLKGYNSSDASETTVLYSVSGDAVTVSNDGTITAAKAGTATVTMTATDASITTAKTYSVDIKVEDAKTDSVTIAIDDDGDDYATVISDVTLGSKVEAKANVPDGMEFRGWVRGSRDNGRLVSTEETYEFTAMTNIYLTAIYTPVATAATNEYYNWNGQFLHQGNTAPEIKPTLIGYTFADDWENAGTIGFITRLIAKFNKNSGTYDVTAGAGESFSMTVEKNTKDYDAEVNCVADKDVYWYRDGKLVDYDTKYNFFIWDDTEITTSDEGHDGAKIMIDAPKDNSCMVEYDAGTEKILEVGILFGDTGATPTVEVCKEKMSSQRNEVHGQFSATSDYAVARGYLIYADGEDYRVIYTDVIELGAAE